MAWKIEFDVNAAKEFKKLSSYAQNLIRDFLRKRILKSGSPYKFGKPLLHDKSGYWRYRIEKYRIICKIQRTKLLVIVVKVGKRDKVYKP